MHILKRPILRFICIFFFAIPAKSYSQITISGAIYVSGQVYEDKNKNSIKDNNEPGIADAVISDQLAVVQSDKTGKYQINARNTNGIIFVSVPTGYKTSASFYVQLKADNENQKVDFPLIKIPV
ncbi:MAG: metallophosphoesterase N-terminal domain-containing protein, partial [Chitinophagaceae bacterium]